MRIGADSPGAFLSLVRILDAGGIAIAPGDTMYGLIGVAPESEARLRRVKGRGEDKPFLVLLADATWTSRMSDLPVPEKLARYWPGPLTIVFPDRHGGTIAMRVPDSAFLRDLARALGKPLCSTSVNRSGAPVLSTVDEMARELENDVDVIYDDGDQPPGAPSTLVDICSHPYRVLRQGALRLSPTDLD
jgi:L-threonylcarbamoyladenylate synthase